MADTREIQVNVPSNTATDILKLTLTCILLPFRPLLVLAAWLFGGSKHIEKQTVYIIRVDCIDGTLRQARIEQDIAGATLDPGDYVSIWGKEKGGVIVVEHAYNHTVGGEVRLEPKRNSLFNLLLLCLFSGLFLALCVLLSSV